MAKKSREKIKESSSGLQTETKHGILAVIFFVFAVFFLLSWVNIGGPAGNFFNEKFHYLLGIGYVLLPTLFVLLGISYLRSQTPSFGWTRTISSVLFLLSSLGIIDVASKTHSGGLLGEILSTPFVALFDVYASIVFLGAILIISILVMFDT
ncbi:DNA translocase FtsK 4TM domain-containing protein, partial [Patescibacteria group bacterium]|nr:DNA translocase FtsK 4TM domain-containing protein [Patescibacteria group bacterium]